MINRYPQVFKHALQIERRSFSQVQRILKSEIAALMVTIMIVIYFTIMVIIFISGSYYHCYYIRHYHHTNPKSVVRRPSRLATALWCYPSEFKEENLQNWIARFFCCELQVFGQRE